MLSDYSSLFLQKRKFIHYVPWLSLISFVLVVAGAITWGVGTSSALKNTNLLLHALRMDQSAALNTTKTIAAIIIAGCCVAALGMLAMSSGRSCTEYTVDRRGAPTRGSRYWLGASAVVTVLWWLLLVLLMFAFFVCVMWFGLMFVVTRAMEAAVDSADSFIAMGIQYSDMINGILEAQFGPLPDDVDTTTCPSTCFNLAPAQYYFGEEICICGAGLLRSAYGYALTARGATLVVVVGCFVVWVGASFLLMNSTADFAQARRERALLLRVQRALAAGDGFTGAGAAVQAKFGVSSFDAPQQQDVVAGAGIELAAAAYGVQPQYGDRVYTDVDKVPLLTDPQQPCSQLLYPQQYQQPQQLQQQQPYEKQYSYHQERPVVVVTSTEQSDTTANSGRQAPQN